jgi:hypothetical protein
MTAPYHRDAEGTEEEAILRTSCALRGYRFERPAGTLAPVNS